MKKRVLIIDDEDLSDEIETLERKFRNKNMQVDFLQFNVGKSDLVEVLTENRIDIKKVKSVFEERYGRMRLHLICFDYNLGPEENVTGVHILDQLRPLISNAQFLFYSSLLEDVVTKILQRQRDGLRIDEAKKLMMSLIKSRVEDFVDRQHFGDAVIRVLPQSGETLDDIFAEKMEMDYPNFRTDYFDGLELSSLAQLLKKNDGRATKIKRELVEQLVAYLVRLQDEE